MSERNERVRTRLSAAHMPGEVGVWQILGEDPNCDLGGSHHQPTLGTVQGTYEDAVEYALELPGFFTWGGGGNIERVNIFKVDTESLRKRALLNGKRKVLTEQLAQVEAELKTLGSK